MKEIITEYGKAVLIFTIVGAIILIITGIFVWGKNEVASDVYAKEDSINKESDKEFMELINTDIDLTVAKDIEINKAYKLKDIITGADYVDIIKVESPAIVKCEDDNVVFLTPGVINMYVDARLATGESTRTWLALGVSG